MTSLSSYRKKRNFSKTPEPKGVKSKKRKKTIFVIQKHFSSRLHYDFRIEINGALRSWAVPKGPSKSTKDKRLAVLTEDHPMEYAKFKGTIPKGEYGAGKVVIWDKGYYENIKEDKNNEIIPIEKCFKKGRIEIELFGKKLKGPYALIKFKDKNWLLIKMRKK